MVSQRPAPVADDDARNRLHQSAIFIRHLFGLAHEYAAWPVHHVCFDARRDQTHDLLSQHLSVTGVIFIPDYQVYRESLQTPVCVRLHELAYQLNVRQVADLQQHNGQIAGNHIAPQAGLPATIPADHARVRTQTSIGIDDGTCKASV